MTDTQRIKELHDLRRLVEQDLGTAPVRSGSASLYRCPFHQDQKGYSLVVRHDGYRCFGKCDTAGDLFDWLMNFRRLSFPDALVALGEASQEVQCPRPPQIQSIASEPPSDQWQGSASEVVNLAEEALWSSEGECALSWLLARGLTTGTIQRARLGYVAGNFNECREIAGLKVPCGITIPWLSANTLWAVKVRRSYGMPKYVQIAGGSSCGLYNADSLTHGLVAVFCKGEFDALLVKQEVGDLVAAVTLGSASALPTARWYDVLTGHRTMLVTYDRDVASQRGTQHLLKLSERLRVLPLPVGKDITEFYVSGGDIYAWIAREVGQLLDLYYG